MARGSCDSGGAVGRRMPITKPARASPPRSKSAFPKSGSTRAISADGFFCATMCGSRLVALSNSSAVVVLMHDRLENFLSAYELSRRARNVIRQNLSISLGVIAALVLLALFQRIPLTVGVVGHEGSTLIVVLNSLRLLLDPKKTV